MSNGPIRCTYGNFPELTKYRDKIYVVYAGCMSEMSITRRTNEDLIEEIKDAVNAGYTKIIYHNAGETLLYGTTFKIQNAIEASPFYNDTMFFMQTSGYDAQAAYDKIRQECPWFTRKLNILSCDHFEFITAQFALGLYEKVIPQYQIKTKQKKFVCFNKVDRVQRVQLLAKVLNTPGMLENSFYSFEGTHSDWHSLHATARFGENIAETLKNYAHLFPLKLNITPNRENPIDLIPEDLYYHDESYFSVITETVFYAKNEYWRPHAILNYADGVFISEKTYRPIAMKHPFILMAYPGTLKRLRERGYKTFSPFIDESYDDIIDGEQRLEAIFKEISRLCAFTDEQWLEWQTNIKPIVEYNYENFNSKTEFGLHSVEHLFAN